MNSINSFLVALLAVATALPAGAAEFRFKKKVDVGALHAQLAAAGFAVKGVTCRELDCVATFADSETRDPSSIVSSHRWEDPLANRRAELAALRNLVAKWKAGTISPAEKDDLILRFIVLKMPAD